MKDEKTTTSSSNNQTKKNTIHTYASRAIRKKLKTISWNGWNLIFYGAWIFRKYSLLRVYVCAESVCVRVWNISLKWFGISIIKRTRKRFTVIKTCRFHSSPSSPMHASADTRCACRLAWNAFASLPLHRTKFARIHRKSQRSGKNSLNARAAWNEFYTLIE